MIVFVNAYHVAAVGLAMALVALAMATAIILATRLGRRLTAASGAFESLAERLDALDASTEALGSLHRDHARLLDGRPCRSHAVPFHRTELTDPIRAARMA